MFELLFLFVFLRGSVFHWCNNGDRFSRNRHLYIYDVSDGNVRVCTEVTPLVDSDCTWCMVL